MVKKLNPYLAIKNGKTLPQESEEELIYAHYVQFIESLTESLLQLCLSLLVLREYGISPNAFNGFMQLSGLLTSLLSVCVSFSKVSYWKTIL